LDGRGRGERVNGRGWDSLEGGGVETTELNGMNIPTKGRTRTPYSPACTEDLPISGTQETL
jgi:hypothetical protein